MAGLVPAIHVLLMASLKTWMPGTRPRMTAMQRKTAAPCSAAAVTRHQSSSDQYPICFFISWSTQMRA